MHLRISYSYSLGAIFQNRSTILSKNFKLKRDQSL